MIFTLSRYCMAGCRRRPNAKYRWPPCLKSDRSHCPRHHRRAAVPHRCRWTVDKANTAFDLIGNKQRALNITAINRCTHLVKIHSPDDRMSGTVRTHTPRAWIKNDLVHSAAIETLASGAQPINGVAFALTCVLHSQTRHRQTSCPARNLP